MRPFLTILFFLPLIAMAEEPPAIGPAKDPRIALVDSRVTTQAASYFKTRAVPGRPSPSGLTLVSIDIIETQPVRGWNGRYRTEGLATVEPVIHGNAYAQRFEAEVEINAENIARVRSIRLLGAFQ